MSVQSPLLIVDRKHDTKPQRKKSDLVSLVVGNDFPAGLDLPQGLLIGENLVGKYKETRHATKPTRIEKSILYHILISC